MTPDERMAAARKALEGCSGWPKGRCMTGKRMYRDRKDAMSHKRDNEATLSKARRRDIRFDVYFCKQCGWWHLSTRD